MTNLSGRTAIITGASQGFGFVVAETFLAAGANIVICARDSVALDKTSASLKSSAEQCLSNSPNERPSSRPDISALKADVSRPADVAQLVEFALTKHTNVDILVNNAGIYGPMGCLEDVTWDDWVSTIEINLFGPALLMRALLPHFKTNNYGKIINLSGGGASQPLPRLSAYAAAKCALVRLTETIASETEGTGINVNAIAPGALNTRLLDQVIESGPEKVGREFYAQALQQKEVGGASLQKAAQLCLFLASDESAGITGRLISAVWDPWIELAKYLEELKKSDIYTLRRIVPKDRGKNWG